jgi:protein-tyrosine phosphatase
LIYWVQDGPDPRLAIVARPEGGAELRLDLADLKSGGIDILVSFLPPDEAEYLGLSDEARLAADVGLQFISYPILDRTVPEDIADFCALVGRLADEVRAGRRVGAHCRGSIGRSTVLIASIMIVLGSDADTALAQIERARGLEVPDTPEQRAWIFNFRSTP